LWPNKILSIIHDSNELQNIKNYKVIVTKTQPVKALQDNKSSFYVYLESISIVETKHCTILSGFMLNMTQCLKN